MRIFISYSNDGPEHSEQVRGLATRLQQDLADVPAQVSLDQFMADPEEGWPRWCENQVAEADRILLVVTPVYRRRYDGKEVPGMGLGASYEAVLIRQRIYKEGFVNKSCRAVVFDAEYFSSVPERLAPHTIYKVGEPTSYQQLLVWLRGGAASASPGPIDHIDWPAPAAGFQWRLADRSSECATFERLVTAQSDKRVLLLHGPSGRGKTALLSRFAEYAEQVDLAVAHLDQKGCPALDEVLSFLELDMGGLLPPGNLLAGGSVPSQRVLARLQRLGKPLLLLFDTYEQASPDSRRWLENLLLPRLDKTPAIVVVVAGQEIPNPSRQVWASLAERVELTLIPDVEEWADFIRSSGKKLPREYVEAFALVTDGDPGQIYPMIESALLKRQNQNSDEL